MDSSATLPPVPTKALPEGLTWIKAFNHFDGKPGSWLPYIEKFESVCSLLGLWWLTTLTDTEAADFDPNLGSRSAEDNAKYKELNEALYCALHITVDTNTASLLRGPKLKKMAVRHTSTSAITSRVLRRIAQAIF